MCPRGPSSMETSTYEQGQRDLTMEVPLAPPQRWVAIFWKKLDSSCEMQAVQPRTPEAAPTQAMYALGFPRKRFIPKGEGDKCLH